MKAFIFTVGSCRGAPFTYKGTIEVEKIEKLAEEITEDIPRMESLEFLENRLDYEEEGELFALFYNCQATKGRLKKLARELRSGKTLIETWEEGTTGISVDGDRLELEVKVADCDAERGEAHRSDISEM